MGPLGSLLHVKASTEALVDEVKSVPPHFVFICETSSRTVKYSNMFISRAIPAALGQLGYQRETMVTVITFDEVAKRTAFTYDYDAECIRRERDPMLVELTDAFSRSRSRRGLGFDLGVGRSSTFMSGVFPLVRQVFDEIGPDTPVVLVAFGNACVRDIEATVKAAQAASVTVGARAAPTTVCIYQLSSGVIMPNLQALTCIGAFNTLGRVPLFDIHTKVHDETPTVETALLGLIDRLVSDLRPMIVRGISLAAPAPILRRMPGDAAIAKIVIPCGQDSYVLLAPGADASVLTCGGAPLALEAAPLRDERAIATFLEFVESQLRLWAVMGARYVQIATVIDWVRQLEALLGAAVQDGAVGPVPVRDRVHKNQSSVIGRILALPNRDRVSALNSDQAAAFLRGDVKSAKKTDIDLIFDGLSSDGVHTLALRSDYVRTLEIHNLIGIYLDISRSRSKVGAPFEVDGKYNGDLPINKFGIASRARAYKWEPSPEEFDAIERYAHAVYRADYAARLAAKRAAEARIRLERLVDELVDSKDYREFVAKLQAGIPNRSAPGYQQLEAALLYFNFNREVPLRYEKLWTIVLGRDREGVAVWANGNYLIGDYFHFDRVFKGFDMTGDLWHEMKAMKARYRRSDYIGRDTRSKANRHGHGNDHPSYWARGYKTLAAFREAVSAEEYEAYAKAHPHCCGFGK